MSNEEHDAEIAANELYLRKQQQKHVRRRMSVERESQHEEAVRARLLAQAQKRQQLIAVTDIQRIVRLLSLLRIVLVVTICCSMLVVCTIILKHLYLAGALCAV